jgi:hypothetical protein
MRIHGNRRKILSWFEGANAGKSLQGERKYSEYVKVVNINLLLKRLKIICLQDDTIQLICAWLRNRSFDLSIDGDCSFMWYGSRFNLGPIAKCYLCICETEYLLAFTDNNYVPGLDDKIASVFLNTNKMAKRFRLGSEQEENRELFFP